jgi:hypothetical protein
MDARETYPKFRQDSNGVPSGILYKRSGNDFHGVGYGPEWPALHTDYTSCLGVQTYADRHLRCSSAWCQYGIEHNIPRNGHRIG